MDVVFFSGFASGHLAVVGAVIVRTGYPAGQHTLHPVPANLVIVPQRNVSGCEAGYRCAGSGSGPATTHAQEFVNRGANPKLLLLLIMLLVGATGPTAAAATAGAVASLALSDRTPKSLRAATEFRKAILSAFLLLCIDVWPHDKPNTTQGPTNIAGLVQVQPHTINRQRLLVLRCE